MGRYVSSKPIDKDDVTARALNEEEAIGEVVEGLLFRRNVVLGHSLEALRTRLGDA